MALNMLPMQDFRQGRLCLQHFPSTAVARPSTQRNTGNDTSWTTGGIHRRATSVCPSNTYTAPNGLDFTMYCGQNLSGSDLQSISADNITVCMDACSSNRPRCYGVAFDTTDARCFFKTDQLTTSNLTTVATTQSAIASWSQLTTFNTTCPYSHLSTQTTRAGLSFIISCQQDMAFGDYCPESYTVCPAHTDTLEGCMDLCTASHPWCSALSWDPEMTAGYGNCYLKDAKVDNLAALLPDIDTHTAIAKPPSANTSVCTTTKQDEPFATDDGKAFQLTCNSAMLSTSNTSHHEPTLDTCIQTCAINATLDCLGVVFDANMKNGFHNCYTLNITSEPTSSANFTIALYSPSNTTASASPTESAPSSTAASTSSIESTPSNTTASTSLTESHSSKSKAWLAGPIVAALLGITLLISFLFWKQKRTNRKRAEYQRPLPYEPDRSPPVDFAAPVDPNTHILHELSASKRTAELEARERERLLRQNPYELGT